MNKASILVIFLVAILQEKHYITTSKVSQEYLYPVETLLAKGSSAEVVKGLLDRLIPERADEFILKLDPSIGPEAKDTFELESLGSSIQITGTSEIALALGVNHFLKYSCKCHVSWSGDQLNISRPLPKVPGKLKIITNERFRYYQNVCTASYSTVWWDWTRWEREIDWMALNGINMPLAFTAQEAIWCRVFTKLGFNDEQIDEFFTGPAFLAWNRMGNFQGFAGPLSNAWHQKRVTLQHQILQRMRDFGMIAVLPAFAGRVPPAFSKLYPNSSVVKDKSHWGHFDEPYCCTSFLEPQDAMFKKIGAMFLQEYIEEFGTDHVYNSDLFNELAPPSSDPDFISSCGKAVYESLIAVDPKAVWLMQGWILVNDPVFWQPSQTKALLTSVPLGRMIILDLEAEFFPQYQRFESYYGQPFIWCMLHNFGGVYGLYGAMDAVNEGTFPARSYPNSTMIGTGLSPEGIEKNDVMYELMNEMAWRTQPVDLDQWVTDYTTRRYGKPQEDLTEAWKLLKRSVYNATGSIINHGDYVLVLRPTLKRTPLIWYEPGDITNATLLFKKAGQDMDLQKQETFKYDFVDLTRQALQIMFDAGYLKMLQAFKERNFDVFRTCSTEMLEVLDQLDMVLSTDDHFSLEKWVSAAKSWASTPQESLQFEYNARNQISLWGPTGQILDYANKQWSGVISGYYKPRWSMFFDYLKRALLRGIPFKQDEFNKLVLWFAEEPFTYRTDQLQTKTIANWFEVLNSTLNQITPTLGSIGPDDVRRKSAKKKKKPRMRSRRHYFPHFVAELDELGL